MAPKALLRTTSVLFRQKKLQGMRLISPPVTQTLYTEEKENVSSAMDKENRENNGMQIGLCPTNYRKVDGVTKSRKRTAQVLGDGKTYWSVYDNNIKQGSVQIHLLKMYRRVTSR